MSGEVGIAVQLALGIVFLHSAASKLRDPKGFAQGVADYKIVPASMAGAVGLLVIGVESWLAIAHLTGWLLAVAVPVGFGTLLSFALAVGVNLRRGRALPCYCFGSRGGESISNQTLTRLVMLLLCESLLLPDSGLFAASQLPLSSRMASFPELALAAFWATLFLVIGSWALSLNDLVDLLRPCKTCAARAEAAEGGAGPNLSGALGNRTTT